MYMLTIFYRTIIMFAVVIVAMRLMGKRQLGELELSELVVAVMISELAAVPITDPSTPILMGIISVATLLVFELVISLIAMKSVRFRSLISGKPSIIIRNGKIDQKEMRKNRFTVNELAEELRNQGVTDISSVKYGILETDGRLNVLLYFSQSPATNSGLGIKGDDNGLPIPVICDGIVLKYNLHSLGYDGNWLNRELKKHKIKSPKDVFMMTIDDMGNIYLSPMEK